MHERDLDPTTRSPNAGTGSTATETAKQATASAKQSASDVAGTAKEQGRQVADQIGTQARSVASDVRHSVAGQARTQNDRLAGGLRQLADELTSNYSGDTGSPAGQLVQRLGDTGRRAADYLQDRGPDGLLNDVQDYARRKPGTFLLAAAAAGFVIGRLGRTTIAAARSDDDSGRTATGSTYRSTGGYEPQPAGPTGALSDPYAAPTTTGTGYDLPSTTGVGTASVEPTGYPVDPVGVPERGAPR